MLGRQFKGKVRDISVEGYGVVDHPDRLVFFVLGTFPGDEGVFEVIKIKDRYGFAKLIELTKISPSRISTPCAHSGLKEGLCGGCPWMGISYERQLELKHHMLSHALMRDHLWGSDREIPPIWGSPQIFGFRNRAQFKTDGDRMGYVSRFSQVIAPINDCLVLNPPLRGILQDAMKMLPRDDWRPTPPHHWSYIDLDDEIQPSQFVANRRRPFRQGNSLQNSQMRQWVKLKTAHWQGGHAIELFCGSGNFTEIIATQGLKSFLAVDIASEGIRQLRQRELGENCTIIEANLFKPSDWKLLKQSTNFTEFLILDPPRDGFNKLDMFVSQWGFPKEIIYISCKLETFTKDVGRLKRKGYAINEIIGVDQFPHTPHIEILAVLQRL
jgi:23S rRNA (uracil1939-C5)-methyltransferase